LNRILNKIRNSLLAETSLNKRRDNQEIIECLENKKLLVITYRKKTTNRVITRTVEPYEIKETGNDKILYAYDRTGRTRNTKSFYISNIISAKKQERLFTPRVF
jgi:predicted DNA-binding transcriptional regulator YafY